MVLYKVNKALLMSSFVERAGDHESVVFGDREVFLKIGAIEKIRTQAPILDPILDLLRDLSCVALGCSVDNKYSRHDRSSLVDYAGIASVAWPSAIVSAGGSGSLTP